MGATARLFYFEHWAARLSSILQIISQSVFSAAVSFGNSPRFRGAFRSLSVKRLNRIGGVEHFRPAGRNCGNGTNRSHASRHTFTDCGYFWPSSEASNASKLAHGQCLRLRQCRSHAARWKRVCGPGRTPTGSQPESSARYRFAPSSSDRLEGLGFVHDLTRFRAA